MLALTETKLKGTGEVIMVWSKMASLPVFKKWKEISLQKYRKVARGQNRVEIKSMIDLVLVKRDVSAMRGMV